MRERSMIWRMFFMAQIWFGKNKVLSNVLDNKCVIFACMTGKSCLCGNYNLLVLLGPTASGKTRLAAKLAALLGGEVISADSRQVYRGMDLGTGKDYSDYFVEGTQVACHLVDIVDAGYHYNVYEYQRDFLEIYKRLADKQVFPLLCGGSGLYLEAVLQGYRLTEVPPDETLRNELISLPHETLVARLAELRPLHNTTDTETKKRTIRAIEIALYTDAHPIEAVEYPRLIPLVVGLLPNRDSRRESIARRLEERLDAGLVEEVEKLLKQGITPEGLEYYGLEYKFLTRYLMGEYSYDTMKMLLTTAICQFAKRQMTWFRRMERQGMAIHWLDASEPVALQAERVLALLKGEPAPDPESKRP